MVSTLLLKWIVLNITSKHFAKPKLTKTVPEFSSISVMVLLYIYVHEPFWVNFGIECDVRLAYEYPNMFIFVYNPNINISYWILTGQTYIILCTKISNICWKDYYPFFLRQSSYIVQTGLEITISFRLALNSWSSCFSLLSAGIIDVHHHSQFHCYLTVLTSLSKISSLSLFLWPLAGVLPSFLPSFLLPLRWYCSLFLLEMHSYHLGYLPVLFALVIFQIGYCIYTCTWTTIHLFALPV
jgi:hypothetical protein